MRGVPILELLTAHRALTILSVATELKLFAFLAEQPRSADALATLAGVRPRPLKALLDACVGLGLLLSDRGQYRNQTLTDAHLVDGRPLYLGHLIHVFASEAPQWDGLSDLLNRGEASDRTRALGKVEPHRFTLAMHSLGMIGEADALTDAIALDGCHDLVDVGCGSGIYSMELCRRYPELRATLIDTEEVLKTTSQILQGTDLAGRIALCARDIVADSYGENRDVVLLSDVLYQSEPTCLTILRSAHRALSPGGTLLVRGYFSDPDEGQGAFGAMFDLARMLWAPDREPITVSCLRQWIAGVGFVAIKTIPLTERSIGLTARKQ